MAALTVHVAQLLCLSALSIGLVGQNINRPLNRAANVALQFASLALIQIVWLFPGHYSTEGGPVCCSLNAECKEYLALFVTVPPQPILRLALSEWGEGKKSVAAP